MKKMISAERASRALSVGAAATVALYLVAVLVAEPLRSFAASDTDGKVSVTVTATASTLECNDADGDSNSDNENLRLHSSGITQGGDTGTVSTARDIHCTVTSNNSSGYTLSWQVTTGSGGTSTGYMISQNEDTIAPFRYNNSNDAQTTPVAWSIDATDSEWGARLADASAKRSEDHASVDINDSAWSTDGNDKWARVASGTSVAFASSTSDSAQAGDVHLINFRAAIGASKVQPTGTYEVEVDFTTANDT